MPVSDTVHDAFVRQAHRTPDAVALTDPGAVLTYAALDTWTNRLAHHLRSLGVGIATPVGVYAPRSAATVAMLLAVLKAGGAFVALDPQYPSRRRDLILADAGIRTVLTTADLAADLPAGCVPVHPDAIDLADRPDTVPSTGVGPDSLAYIAYTSGSTGRPKGVCVPHRAVRRLVLGADFLDIRDDDVFLQLAPLAFDASTLEVWGPLVNGARLAVPPAGDLPLHEIADLVRDLGVTVLWLTAGLFHRMVDAGVDDLRGLRYLLAGGDVLSAPHVARALAALPETILINGYGPTENTTFTCCHPVPRGGPVGARVPIGRPIRGTRVHVLDDRLRPVADGDIGELYAGGDGLALGYLGSAALTALRFVADPFAAARGQRLYRTGDLVRRGTDGSLEFIGRNDGQVKIRGFRVEPGEVEAAVAALADVGDAAVVAPSGPSGERRLIAYVAPAAGVDASPLAIRAELAAQLPAYAVPTLVRIVDRLPLTENGKVDRSALATRVTPDRPELISPYRAPVTSVTRAVAQLWSDHLGVVPIGADDDFFELGGDSLLAVTLIGQLRRAYGVEVTPVEFYLNPSPSGLAAVIEVASGLEQVTA